MTEPSVNRRSPTARTYYGLLVLADLTWAGNYVFAPMVLTDFTPLQMVYIRWLLSVAPLLLLAGVIEKPDWKTAWREWPTHLLQAVLGIAGYTLLLYEGLKTTSPLDASMLGAMTPAVIMVMATLLIRERVGAGVVIGILLSSAGALLVISRGDLLGLLSGRTLTIGDLWIVVSVIVWALYSVVQKTVHTPPITATALQALFAVAGLTPLVLATGILPAAPSASSLWGMLYIAVFASIAGFVMWNLGVVGVGASRSGIFLNLIMVFTAIIGLFLGESVSLPQIIGGAIVFAGVYLCTRPSRRDARTAP